MVINKIRCFVHIFKELQKKCKSTDIKNCIVSRGELPPKQTKLVLAWTEIHKEELLADWELTSKGELPFPIEPLK